MVYVIATIELVGGVLIFFGLATRIIGVLFALTLVGAIFTAKLSSPFMGGSEFDFILLVASIHLALSGSRLLSLDQLFSNQKGETFQHKKEGVQMTGIHQDTAIGYVKLTIKIWNGRSAFTKM